MLEIDIDFVNAKFEQQRQGGNRTIEAAGNRGAVCFAHRHKCQIFFARRAHAQLESAAIGMQCESAQAAGTASKLQITFCY